MINKDQIIPLLITVTPSFQTEWDEHRNFNGEDLVYVVLGDYARKLIQLQKDNKQDELHSVAKIIERILVEGTPETRETITIGLLESIQNILSHTDVDPEIFANYLLPESLKWWRSLNAFWSGKIKYVGEDLA